MDAFNNGKNEARKMQLSRRQPATAVDRSIEVPTLKRENLGHWAPIALKGRSNISWRRGEGGRFKPRRQVSVREWEGGFAKSVSWRSTFNFEQFTHGIFFFFKLQSISKHETKTPDLITIHGIHYKSRMAKQGDATYSNIARSKQKESGCCPHLGPLIGCHKLVF